MDVLFLTEDQERDLARCCLAFFSARPAAPEPPLLGERR
jgi:hypothetical protein